MTTQDQDTKKEINEQLKCASNNIFFIMKKIETMKSEQIVSFLESAKVQIETAIVLLKTTSEKHLSL